MMKNSITCFLLLSMMMTSYCQQTNPPLSREQADYMRKSKNLRNVGFIILGSGVAAIAYGAIVALAKSDEKGLVVLALVGVPLTIISVPFFNASIRNKEKANSITGLFKFEREPFITTAGVRHIAFPSIAIRIGL